MDREDLSCLSKFLNKKIALNKSRLQENLFLMRCLREVKIENKLKSDFIIKSILII